MHCHLVVLFLWKGGIGIFGESSFNTCEAPYYFDEDGFEYYESVNDKSTMTSENFNEALNGVSRKARRNFNESKAESSSDDQMFKQIMYFALIFGIKVCLYLAIKKAVDENCEPLL